MHDQIVSEEQQRQEVWEKELANFDEPDESFVVSSEYLLSLLNRLPELYDRSKDDEKLHLELKKPFDAVLLCSETKFWLPRLDGSAHLCSLHGFLYSLT